jgi:hypothetical protein
LLNMYIVKNNDEIIRVLLSELWLLSISKKWCVNYNFLKLIAIANKSPIFLSKFEPKLIDDFYKYCRVSVPSGSPEKDTDGIG